MQMYPPTAVNSRVFSQGMQVTRPTVYLLPRVEYKSMHMLVASFLKILIMSTPGQGPVRIAPVRSQERRRELSSMRVAGLLALTMGAI